MAEEKRSAGPVTMAAGGAAAATTIVCWILGLAGVDVPGEVQGSLTTLLVLFAGWLVRPGSGKRVAG